MSDPTIDETALVALVVELYGSTATRAVFEPVGGDSWAYRVGDWWVSVRRDRQGHVALAYEAAHALRVLGLDFVLAPERGRNGAIVQQLGSRPVIVSRYVAGRTIFPDLATEGQARAVEGMVRAIHAACVAPDLPRETFDQPFAEQLEDALARARAGGEASGPFGERVTRLVRAHGDYLASLQEEMHTCQAACRRRRPALVLTHGEPNRGNVFVTVDERLLLLDWGELAWAPPERDLVMRADLDLPRRGDELLLRFYELRWVLSEIAEYVQRFVEPHTGDMEDQGMWRELLQYVPRHSHSSRDVE